MTMKSGGNIGIGTATPTEKLQVTGNISASGDFIGTNFTGSSFTGSFVGDGSGLTGLNSGSWDGIFTGSAQITGSLGVTGSVLVDGNVGIGTTSPNHLLDLYKSTGTTSSTTGTTLQRLWNYVGSDLNQQKTFIDFVFQDNNDNEYPQVRIGAEVGQNGDASSQQREGSGAFIVTLQVLHLAHQLT